MSLKEYPLIRHWLEPGEGERLLVRTGKVDIGQRISTALVRIAAEELHLPPEAIDVARASTARGPNEGITSGSNSVEQSGGALRLAAPPRARRRATLWPFGWGWSRARLRLRRAGFRTRRATASSA